MHFKLTYIFINLQENFTVIISYLFALKIGSVHFLDHDAIKNFIESTLGQQHFNDLIKSQYTHILLKCIQMVIESKIEQPIIPIQINKDQFLNIINIFQVKYNSVFMYFLSINFISNLI